MNADESIRLEFLSHSGNGFAQQMRATVSTEGNVVSFRVNGNDVCEIDEKNFSSHLNRHARRWLTRRRKAGREWLERSSRFSIPSGRKCDRGFEIHGDHFPKQFRVAIDKPQALRNCRLRSDF